MKKAHVMRIPTEIEVGPRRVRVLAVSDLHRRSVLYAQLATAVAKHRPDVVAVVGDFLDASFPQPKEGMISAAEAAGVLSALPCECVFVRGNHEDEGYLDFDVAWPQSRPLHTLHGSAWRFGPLIIVGFPCWTGDGASYAAALASLERYHAEEWLPELLRAAGPAGRALWLMHEPPSPALASPRFWDALWNQAVRDYQPIVTVSGHDHSTPLRTGVWSTKIGETVCISAGQRVYPPGELIYCVLDFGFPGSEVSLPTTFTYRRFGGSDPGDGLVMCVRER